MIRQLIIYIMLFSVSGCYYDVEEELYPATVQCDTVIPTYNSKIAPLIASNCAIPGCHISNSQSPDLSNYNSLVANIARVKIRAIGEKTMPPSGPMLPCDIVALQRWIDAGTMNN